NNMKKIILIGFLLIISACQTAAYAPTLAPKLFPTSTTLPSPIPVAASPEPLPTLELSPTPFPRLFTEGFDYVLTGWAILQAGNDSVPNIKNENGNLILQMDSPYTWLYALYGAQDYTNVRIDTQFENRALTPSSAGLICRYSDEGGWLEYNISSDGTYNVLYGKWLSNGIADYLPITDGTSKEIQPTGTTQKIGLTCSDTILWLYINDKLIRKVDVSRYALAQGEVGIATSSFENTPIVTAFDQVTISEP
ncbi:MAG: hypothetical protein ABI986_13090, partial [Chloroflexota bacterium]